MFFLNMTLEYLSCINQFGTRWVFSESNPAYLVHTHVRSMYC